MRRSARELGDGVEVEDVRLVEREVRMLRESRPGERVAVQVVERDDLVVVDQPARERRADEACSTGHEDPFPLQRHAPEPTP